MLDYYTTALPIYGISVNSVKSSIYTGFACENHKMLFPNRPTLSPDWSRSHTLHPSSSSSQLNTHFAYIGPFARTWRLYYYYYWEMLLYSVYTHPHNTMSVLCGTYLEIHPCPCLAVRPFSAIIYPIYQMLNWICAFPFW